MSVSNTFNAFCAAGHVDMDGKTFAKLCKDCSLIDSGFSATDVDLLFAKVVPKGQRRMSIDHFNKALEHIVQRKNLTLSVVQSTVAACRGPVIHATQADAVRFHDDKSTYTGTHANGGPESVAVGAGTAADQTWKRQNERLPSKGAERLPSKGAGERRSSKLLHPGTSVDVVVELGSAEQEVFGAFCGDGNRDLDGKSFAKLCKDSHLLDRHFTATDADLVFAKAVPKAQRRMNIDHFALALGYIAQKKNVSADVVQSAVADCGGPVLHATHAEAVRFHDDKSTYTGTHAKGGPESVAVGTGSTADQSWKRNTERRPSTGAEVRRPSTSSRLGTPGTTPKESPRLSYAEEAVFKTFCGEGKIDMDGKSFAKLCQDCQLLDRNFMATDADLVFAKAVPKGQRRMDTGHFAVALTHVASKKNVSVCVVQAAVADCSGPVLHATVADTVRFHDDKSTYTGTHVFGGPESAAIGSGSATDQSWKRRVPSKDGGDRQPSKLSSLGDRVSESAVDAERIVTSEDRDGSDDGCLDSAHVGTGFRAVRKIRRSHMDSSADFNDIASASPGQADRPPPPHLVACLGKAFASYATPHADMDGKTFAKLCKDCHFFDKRFSQTDADLAFAKVVAKGQRRICFQQFETLLASVAEKKGTTYDEVQALVGHASGPVLLGTRTAAVRFHDDKSTYTGTHVNGGPESVAVGAGSAADQSWKRR